MRKHYPCVLPRNLRDRPSEQGAALVIVLAILVLVAILIVGFLTRATSERSASASYHATATTRQLADTAVNLVQAQINDATSAGPGNTWASQPGAVRVFNSSGNLSKLYRLYSAASMKADVTDASVLANDIPPANWASSPALWVDLNQPVFTDDLNGAQQSIFPILDPRDPADPGSPLAPKVTAKLDGFEIAGAPGSTAAQPAPMPTRWLYILQNGQVVAPAGSGQTVTIDMADKENPIVGRIAFWTDDESSKININTAAGNMAKRNGKLLPTPWDLPRFRIYDERQLFSENQPVSGEYQRYPGHPANTDLSRVFNALGIPNMASIDQPGSGTASQFFDLLPRLNDDKGSKGGTVNTTKSNVQDVVTAKDERLFSSLGELSFNPDRQSNGVARQQLESGKFFLTANSRAPEITLFGTPRIITWPIDSDYGDDPTPGNTTKLASTFDKVIAFCGTTGTGNQRNQYYFQRHDATSPTNDYSQIPRNQQLYSYLQRLTGQNIPGYGGNFLSKYSFSGERDQILTEIVDYIRSTNVFDHAIKDQNVARFTPKAGNSGFGQVVPLQIGDTRGLGRMYTLSEIGLLIISTADGNGKKPEENGSAEDWRSVSNLPPSLGDPPETYPLKNSAGEEVLFTGNPTLADVAGTTGPILESGQKRLQAMLLLEVSSPMLGFDQMTPNIKVSASGMDNLQIGGAHPFPSEKLTNANVGSRPNYVTESGGINGFQYLISRIQGSNNTQARVNRWSNPSDPNAYQFVSNPFTVTTDATGQGSITMGGSVTIQLEVPQKGGGGNTVVVQTFNVQFPATTVPIPDLIQIGSQTKNAQGNPIPVSPRMWWGFDRRISAVGGSPSLDGFLSEGSVIRVDPATIKPGVPKPNWTEADISTTTPLTFYKDTNGIKPDPATLPASDVVRSLIAQGGDTRLVMAKETVDASGSSQADMTAHPGYFDTPYKLVHSFMQSRGANQVPGTDLGGKLVPNAPYDKIWAPKVPSNLTPGADWDWDTGLTGSPDGAYANKPDEGNIYSSGGLSPYYNAEQQANNNNFGNLTSYFTANRIIPSAVMFGSLPTGVKEGVPWRTLLFRPQKNRPRDPSGPKDYLLLDLFSMPVVEPYAISEPFSTAGKVNMNYQIVPFTYITRNAGVRAVLGSELIARVPKKAAALIPGNTQSYYKAPYGNMPIQGGAQTSPTMARLPLNLSDTDGTLRQFKAKFDSWGIFKSPSEICDVYLVPEGYSWASDNAADVGWYGDDFAMVGDNVRERPYAHIYPRLTTQSNTFTVHYTVQALKNANSKPEVWDEKKGAILGEYRGATTIERFIDPSNNRIPDYATDVNAPSLETFYQWRTIRNQSFSQ